MPLSPNLHLTAPSAATRLRALPRSEMSDGASKNIDETAKRSEAYGSYEPNSAVARCLGSSGAFAIVPQSLSRAISPTL